MTRDTDLRAGKRSWVRCCATILAFVLVLVAIHQVVPHHPSHGRCPACVSLHRPSLAASAVQVALPLPVSTGNTPAPVDRPFHSDFRSPGLFRGPPTLLAV
jgi:hypothetical protein